jgi:hypothetical protein
MKGKFKIPPRPADVATGRESLEQFVEASALSTSVTQGRELKPVRINFDMSVEEHRILKRRAVDKGMSVAELVRQLIRTECAR